MFSYRFPALLVLKLIKIPSPAKDKISGQNPRETVPGVTNGCCKQEAKDLGRSHCPADWLSTNHFQDNALFKRLIHIPVEASLLLYSPKYGLEPSFSTEDRSVNDLCAMQSASFARGLIVYTQ